MKKYLILSILLVSGVSSMAQSGFSSLHYDVSFGLGKTNDFISKPSFRGFGFDFKKMVNAHVGVGVSIAWHVFYEKKDFATYTLDDGVTSLSGIQYRSINALPMHLNGSYYFGEETSKVRPFLGVGVGTLYMEKRTEMGQWALTDHAWEFSLQPEVGLLYGASPDVNLFVAGKFTTPFETSSFDSHPYATLNFGMAWMFF